MGLDIKEKKIIMKNYLKENIKMVKSGMEK